MAKNSVAPSSTTLSSIRKNNTTEKMLQVDIFPVDVAREESWGLERCEGSVGLLGREVDCANGRRIRFEQYRDETQLEEIMGLIGKELSEPYSIYTYRYFVHHWPELCILAVDCASHSIVGSVVCKMDRRAVDEESDAEYGQGYIAMLAVDESYRGVGLGTRLVRIVLEVMREQCCDEVVLETEVNNSRSLSLYGRLGFIRESRLYRYYLNGGDAFRLKLYLERQHPMDNGAVHDTCGETEGQENQKRNEITDALSTLELAGPSTSHGS